MEGPPLDLSPPDGCLGPDYDSLASDQEIEAKAMELKEKIFAECGLVTRRQVNGNVPTMYFYTFNIQGRLARNTRNPSKIWKWFTKTPTFIYCKICGLGIKNSGNTTNASSHLKRHPEHYADFRLESVAQSLEAVQDTEPGLGGRSAEVNIKVLIIYTIFV